MNNLEKITELLHKENLSQEEKLHLEQLIAEDKEAGKFVETYKKVNTLINSSSHLSTGEISDYILYKNNLEPEVKNIIKSIAGIEDHLRSCLKCSEEFQDLNEEFSGIENFVASEMSRETDEQKTQMHLPVKRKINIYRYVFLSLIVLGILYGVMFTISKMTAPRYYDLASIESKPDFYTTRGRATNDFLKCLNALDEGNINEAIECLKSDIKNNPGDETIFYSYYILGLTYLDNAENDLAGLFPHYNNNYIDLAIKNLQTAIQKNDSGNYRNVTLDAYFYLAKANLMKGNSKEAKKELINVVKEKGSKMNEAENILNALE
jgi:TolA-binding protein